MPHDALSAAVTAADASRALKRLLLMMVLLAGAGASLASLDTQRQQFLDARAALSAGDTTRFHEIAAGLRDYPLYPYLRYAELRRGWAEQQDEDIRAFLEAYADLPLADLLRSSWLRHLGKQQQWERFLAFYRGSQSTELACYKLQAESSEPPTEAWLDQVQALWLVGHSQPDACDPVFDVLADSPRMTRELVWSRIRLAFGKGKLGLASYLARRLPEPDRHWVGRWRRAHVSPAEMLADPAMQSDTVVTRDIVLHALKRLGRGDASAARERWLTLRDKYAFSDQQRAELERGLALYAAYERDPNAFAWLGELPASVVDDKVIEWRARTALRTRNWEGLLASIKAMDASRLESSEWRYWKAYALEQLDQEAVAMAFFGELAGKRDYYGFLAADQLDWTYTLTHDGIASEEAELNALLARYPGLVRARELFLAGEAQDARREWRYLINTLTPRELELAALLAHRWGWHDRAILTAARAGHLDDLELRFPVLYEEQVGTVAKAFDLEPAWIFGVMRQESAFMADARSPAGALGLMQLMPATGRSTARLLELPKPSRQTLLQADPNIRIGSGYLRHILDRFDGNQALATAAYNAGPQRVKGWLPEDESLPGPVWVDTIPFTETRRYVRAVLAFTTVYESKLERPVTRLSQRMPPVQKSAN
jgi:soluble lytic murein transglycosylase